MIVDILINLKKVFQQMNYNQLLKKREKLEIQSINSNLNNKTLSRI